MPFPQGTDYNIAVQNPKTAFADPHLKECLAEITPLGLPKPYSGGFTTTYHLLNPKLGYDWAVRCFTRGIPNLEARYKALEGFFNKHRQERYFVKTWHLQDGIRAASAWHPAIKMQWIEGASLDGYVRAQLSKPQAIQKLATEFVALIRRLEQIGFAHGDLQHGNILVKDSHLYLIDYDGSYVPEIAGLGTNNLGHVNYQHPARSEALFNAGVDRFSAMVIYLALTAIAAQPALWLDFDTGENLLFRREDFTDATTSALFARLSSLNPVSALTNRFKQICRFDPQDMPSLDEFMRGDFVAPKTHAVPWYGHRSQYPIIDCNQRELVLQHMGKRVEVVGLITGVFENREYQFPYQFLNLGHEDYPNHAMTLVLWTEGLKSFQDANRDPWKLMNKWVSATGVVSVHNVHGRLIPQIIVDYQAQVHELADGANEARARLAAYALNPEISPTTPVTARTIHRWQEMGDRQHEAQAVTVFNRLYGSSTSNGAQTTTFGPRATSDAQPQAAAGQRWYDMRILGQPTPQPRVIGGSGNRGNSGGGNMAHAATASSHVAAPPLSQAPSQFQIVSSWQKLKQWLFNFAELIRQRL